MTLRLAGSTSGFTEIDAPAVAGSNTLILPGGNGNVDQALVTNGSGTLSWSDRARMVVATAQTTTSGTFVDFTGIPSWVKRVTVMFQGVSTSGTSAVDVRLGTSGGIQATGYTNFFAGVSGVNTCSTATFTTGCTVVGSAATSTRTGNLVFVSYGSNNWTFTHITADSSTGAVNFGSGFVGLSGTLDRVRITAQNGTDTFDAGSINIMYEG